MKSFTSDESVYKDPSYPLSIGIGYLPAVEQEPVGYVTKVSNGNLIFTDGVPMNKESVPVYYTQPQPTRMPLSSGDIREIYKFIKEKSGLDLSIGTFLVAFDAAEKAHGIGV
jgi:hypothetical protein